jgi:hypothetical protein
VRKTAPPATLAALLLCAATAQASGPAPLHHELTVRLDPAAHRIEVRDEIAPAGAVHADAQGHYRFALHAGLRPKVKTRGWKLQRESGPVTADFFGINATTDTVPERVPLEGWRLVPKKQAPASVAIEYAGEIHHPLDAKSQEYARGFRATPGIVGEEGVFLSGTTFWVPTFGEGRVTFDLTVKGLDPAWHAVSQGKRGLLGGGSGADLTRWVCRPPQEEIYLVAGPWTVYSDRLGETDLFAFLRTPDPALATRYLDATKRYIKMYESALPPYPYPTFALVENFWETGYGMPGFTLLGPTIIRFPWILTSSYPHEILHTWWGNSVYVDPSGGNWCEGLTAYMADHMFAEQKGEAAVYRRATLKKYTDYVRDEKDRPLSSFRSRHSPATEAVGYGKSLMLFHMLRRDLGEQAFLLALSNLAEDYRYAPATFADLADEFTAATGREWGPWFEAWTTRAGAPLLEIASHSLAPRAAGPGREEWVLEVALRQAQEEEPFPVTVPVAVTLEGVPTPMWVDVEMDGREGSFDMRTPARPLRVDVDPQFDVMRRLDPMEVPPALSTVFGADEPLFVLPSAAPPEEQEAWRALVEGWQRGKAVRIALDSELSGLPEEAAWLLGWDNRHRGALAARLAPQGVTGSPDGLGLGGETYGRENHSVVLTARAQDDPAVAIGWIGAGPVAAVPGLMRKLPHYTRYSYLAFRGDEPTNVAKGMWEPSGSPLTRNLGDGQLPALEPPKRSALMELPSPFDGERLLRTAAHLASPRMEGRGLGSPGLALATAWVEERFREIGLEPAGDAGYRQAWSWRGGEPEREMELVNLLGRVPGSDPAMPGGPVLVLAHLDHLGRGWPDVRGENVGKVHPGADDNASGVAVLLELARATAAAHPKRAVLFAVVTGEEAGLLGSRHLLDGLGDALPFACLNLDTVGRLGDGKLLVLNAESAREWRFIFMGVGYTTGTPISIVPEPLDASDQVACLEKGVPGVQLFAGPHLQYHRPSDTADRLDAGGMVKVTEAAHEAVSYLSGRKEPLTAAAARKPGRPEGAQGPPAGGRRAALGTMPDFTYRGPGVRVEKVIEGSAAEEAGILAGDVLVAMDDEKIADLRDYSRLLKAHRPRDLVELTIERGGETVTLRALLRAR